MADSGENSPCRISDAEKSPRKTLAEFFREDPFNETNDNEIEENAKLNEDCSVRDLSNEEIKELVGTLKDTNLRFSLNANKPREIVDHKKLKEKTSDDDVGKLRRLPKVRVNEIGQQSIYDQDIFNENQALSEEEIEEILQSNHLHSSRITIPSHEQQIVEQNFEVSPESKQMEFLKQRNRAHGKNILSGHIDQHKLFTSMPTLPTYDDDQQDFSFDLGSSVPTSPTNGQQEFAFGFGRSTEASPTRSTTASPTISKTASPTISTPTRSTTASPTRSTAASPTRSTTASPTISTPTRSTTASPIRSTAASPTRSTTASPTRSTPTRSTTASPTRSTAASPTRSTTASPTRSIPPSPTRSTTAPPTRSTPATPTRSTTASPTRLTPLSPTRSTPESPTRSPPESPTTPTSPTRSTLASPTSSSSSPNAKLNKTKKSMSFNRLFRRRSFTEDEHQQLTEDDYARWRRWKENEASFEMIVHTIRQRLDHWDNEVKTQKQIKISAQELGVRPPKREWDETRLNRIEHLRNEVRASSAALPMQASPSASSPLQALPSGSSSLQASSSASPLHKGGGPHTNRSLYSSAELIKNVGKKEDTEIMVTKKYDVASHGRTLEEAKENLIRYDQKMEELRRFERQFEVLSYTGSAEVLTEQQRIEKQYEKQYVAQKIVRQISTLNGALNCLYVNVSEMLQSGFTEEKKKLSKTFIDILRRVQRDEDETDDDVANLNNV